MECMQYNILIYTCTHTHTHTHTHTIVFSPYLFSCKCDSYLTHIDWLSPLLGQSSNTEPQWSHTQLHHLFDGA